MNVWEIIGLIVLLVIVFFIESNILFSREKEVKKGDKNRED